MTGRDKTRQDYTTRHFQTLGHTMFLTNIATAIVGFIVIAWWCGLDAE